MCVCVCVSLSLSLLIVSLFCLIFPFPIFLCLITHTSHITDLSVSGENFLQNLCHQEPHTSHHSQTFVRSPQRSQCTTQRSQSKCSPTRTSTHRTCAAGTTEQTLLLTHRNNNHNHSQNTHILSRCAAQATPPSREVVEKCVL